MIVFFEGSSSTLAAELRTNTLKKRSLVAVGATAQRCQKGVCKAKGVILEHDSAGV